MVNRLITLNTKQGEKSVSLLRNGENTNLLNYMKSGSAWLQLAVGVNNFTFTASNQDLVKILFASVELFGGV